MFFDFRQYHRQYQASNAVICLQATSSAQHSISCQIIKRNSDFGKLSLPGINTLCVYYPITHVTNYR